MSYACRMELRAAANRITELEEALFGKQLALEQLSQEWKSLQCKQQQQQQQQQTGINSVAEDDTSSSGGDQVDKVIIDVCSLDSTQL